MSVVDFEFEFLFEYVLASDIESVFEPLADFEFEFAFEYFLVFDIESVFGPVLVSVFELAFVLGHVRKIVKNFIIKEVDNLLFLEFRAF